MSAPHMPRQDDDVADWLKRMRDYNLFNTATWNAINGLLDRYRELADYGLSLAPEDDGRGDP